MNKQEYLGTGWEKVENVISFFHLSCWSYFCAWQGEHIYVFSFSSVIACWYLRESLLTLMMCLRSTGALLMVSPIRM